MAIDNLRKLAEQHKPHRKLIHKQRRLKLQPVEALFVNSIAIIIVTIILLPLLWTALLSVKSEQEIFTDPMRLLPTVLDTDNYNEMFDTTGLATGIGNSLLVIVISVVVALVCGTFAGYGLSSKRERRFDRQLLLLILLPQIIPGSVLVIPLFQLFASVDLLNTIWAIGFSHAIITLPIVTLIMRDAFRGVPDSLIGAGRADGASATQIFNSIALPQAAPQLLAAAFAAAFISFTDLTFALTFGNRREEMVATVIANSTRGDLVVNFGILSAMVIVMAFIPILIWLLLRPRMFSGLSLGIVHDP